MLVMFAAGVADLVWMAGLAAVMAYEKTGRRGRQLTPVVGAALLAWAALVLAHPAWLPHGLAGIALSGYVSTRRHDDYRNRRTHMSWSPYENLPPAAAFSLTSSDLREGEKLAMPQV